MSISAQTTLLSFARQSAKVGDGTFNLGAHDWYKLLTPRSGLGPQQYDQDFPPENGAQPVPRGVYKTGAEFSGDFDLIPRAEEDLGWLLLALMGNSSSAVHTGVSSVYKHTFSFAADGFTLPWMAWRHMIPGRTSGENYGRIGYDCMMNGAQITVPNAGLLASTWNVQGRVPKSAVGATGWTYVNDFEESTTAPVAGYGTFKIGGVTYPLLNVTLNFTNGLSGIREEQVIGSFYADDYITLRRAAQLRIIYKYANPTLSNKVLNGTANAADFDALPFIETTSGGVKAVDAVFKSPKKIPGTSECYEFGFNANRVAWRAGRVLEVAAGGLITQEFMATILEVPGSSYFDFYLQNEKASYVW